MIFNKRRIPVYNPEDDEDLFYWFDAADTSTLKGAGGAAITNGAQVYEWLNKKGSQKFVQHSTIGRALWQTNQVNGLPALTFSGNRALGIDDKSGFAELPGFTLLIVAGSNNYSNFQRIVYGRRPGDGSTVVMLDLANGATNRDYVRLASGRLSSHGPGQEYVASCQVAHNSAVHIFGFSVNYEDGFEESYRDGVRFDRREGFSTGLSENATLQYLVLGATVSNTGALSNYLNGKIAHIFLWRRALSPQELVGPHHYLRTKWRIEPSPSSGGMSLMMENGGDPSLILNCENCEEPLNEVGMCDSCYSNEEM